MKLLAHQERMIDLIEANRVSAIYAPRQNGKTVAAIHAAWRLGGRTLFLSPGFALAKHNLLVAEGVIADATKVVKTNGRERVEFPGGCIEFSTLSKKGAPGRVFDTIILDGADVAKYASLDPYYPCLFTIKDPRLVLLGVAPDGGVAEEMAGQGAVLRWASVDAAEANPAYGTLINPEALKMAEEIMPATAFRREHLGLSALEWRDAGAEAAHRVVESQLHWAIGRSGGSCAGGGSWPS